MKNKDKTKYEDVVKLMSNEEIKEVKEVVRDEIKFLLFKDFRLKKAQELYDNMEWNIVIWKECFKYVLEREKKKEEEKKFKESLNKKSFDYFTFIKNPLNNAQHAIMSFLIIFFTLLFFGLYAMYGNKDGKFHKIK